MFCHCMFLKFYVIFKNSVCVICIVFSKLEFLHCYNFAFILIYHILKFCIFHDANVVIPSMIWVFICYVARARMSAL